MLGYFSLIGLLRVHVLLGDYTLALKVVEHVELGQRATLTRVTACHVATYYYVGFCYVALRRYADATRAFASVLNFIGRMRQYHTRSYQYDQARPFLASAPSPLTGRRSTRRRTGCTRCLRCARRSRRAGWTTRC